MNIPNLMFFYDNGQSVDDDKHVRGNEVAVEETHEESINDDISVDESRQEPAISYEGATTTWRMVENPNLVSIL